MSEAVRATTRVEPTAKAQGGARSSLHLQRQCACGSRSTSASGECESCRKKHTTGLQAKLRVGSSTDRLELEADRIADQVLAMPNTHHSGVAAGQADAPPRIQRATAAAPDSARADAPLIVDDVLRSPGWSLDAATRGYFEPRFGHDFAQLQVHASTGTSRPRARANLQAARSTGAAATGDPGSTSGTSDQRAQPLQQCHPDLPGNPAACVVSSALPAKFGPVKRTSTGSVTQSFEVNVEWREDMGGEQSYCAAACGEYHQFVKGYMLMSSNEDGSDPKDVGGTVFGGVKLDRTTFNEDGLNSNPKARYGHRAEKQTMNESYSPTREHGTKYVGKDEPGVHIGTYADFELTFVGKLVDTCQGTETTSDPWRVAYRGVIRP